MLDQICRTIVETGGYRMAWVGYSETDEWRTIRPAARAGVDGGFLDSLDHSWDDTERGRTPMGIAIRTGKPSVIHIAADGVYAPWRERALQSGYAACLALPLLARDSAFGGLGIFSAAPEAFDAAEVKLLVELANDLAYGITALRTRAAHDRAEEALRFSERRFRALVENSGMLINLINSDGVLIYVSPAATGVVGYTPEEMVGRRAVEFLHPDEIEDRQRPFSRMVHQPGVTMKVERRVRHKGGSWRWVEGYSTNLIDDPAVGALVFNYRDITDRKQAEEQIRRNAARAQALAEVSRTLAEVTQDFPALLDQIAQFMSRLIGDACRISLISEDGQWLQPVAIHHPRPEAKTLLRAVIASAPQRTHEGLSRQVLETGQPLLIPVVNLEEMRAAIKPEHWPYWERVGVHSLIITPLRVQSHIIGVLYLSRDAPGHPYTLDDQTLAQDLADRAALAIANARLLESVQRELAERQRAEAGLRENEGHARSLLRLSKRLEQAQTYSEALGAALDEVKAALGYQNVWVYLLTEDKQQARLLTTTGGMS
ncbi:MAG: GAF domain-containing protein, partial [Acidobacteria bacterium]|nr:GAF domain-containing protein [Acidobacteriota bacterium]